MRVLDLIVTLSLFLGSAISGAAPAKAASLGTALKASVPKATRVYRDSATGKGALTEAMIEKCIVFRREIDLEWAEAEKIKGELDVTRNEIKTLQEGLARLKPSVNRRDSLSLANYNNQVKFLRAKGTEYQVLRDFYNNKIGPYEELVATFDRECNGQPYYEDDYARAAANLGFGM